MPRRRRARIGQRSIQAQRRRGLHDFESRGQRFRRLDIERRRNAQRRLAAREHQGATTSDAARRRMRRVRFLDADERQEAILEAVRVRMRRVRLSANEHQRAARRQAHRLRMRQARATAEEEQRAAIREADRERRRQERLAADEDQQAAEREAARERMRQARLAADEIQQAARREADREHRLQERLAATNEQRAARLEARRARYARARRTVGADLNLAAFRYDATQDYSRHPNVVIGKMDTVCAFCGALKFKNEPPGMCCSNGKVKLPELLPPPEPLSTLIAGESNISKHFLSNIRKYNSCFQMTSFGASNIIHDNRAQTFKIQGQVYHLAGSLLPMPDTQHKYLQIYFMGNTDVQIDQRCRWNTGVRREIVADLQNFLNQHNQLIHLFKIALEQMPADEYKIIIHADKTPIGQHARRYNTPTIDEVAILIAGEESNPRDIVLHRRNGELQRVSETHRSYDGLQYPLLFWQGEDGYDFSIKLIDPQTGAATNKKVSAMCFYSYRLMIRANAQNHILKFQDLLNQFVVDMCAKIETERLIYIRLNQTKLRAEEYIHLRDAIANDANANPNELGQQVILPATFTGSPRHMHEYAQDAMAYVRHSGRPDLFITFTCNPTWEEIKELLLPGQSPKDRHDIISRVFKQKLKSFIDFFAKYEAFGGVLHRMHSVEWQKRGLPHAHALIWFVNKITPEQIDQVISAEIPDNDIDPELFQIVTKNMIHGPCGPLNPTSPCMSNGKCTKRYPRQLLAETVTGNDGYPLYRRRAVADGGKSVVLRVRDNDVEVDNRWVVPYSPLLSKTFKTHINVEYCSSVKSIKYICKYINKGSDMAVFGVGNAGGPVDEVAQYQVGRYISSNEAFWRIFSFPIHERHPAVVHLSVHLENGQRVYFTTENARERALAPPPTTLTAFFSLCGNDAFARTLLYSEVPTYYTWNPSAKVFQRRKQGKPVEGHANLYSTDTLGRLYTVHPSNAECFYLRLLLLNVRGPTSFQDLRTVNGQVCATYREACQQLGLLENDAHWDLTLADAATTAQPSKIRTLFAIVLTTCFPANPNELWEKYKDSMSEDILFRVRATIQNQDLQFTADMYNEALILIENKCLAIAHKKLVELDMPAPNRDAVNLIDHDLFRETNFDIDNLAEFVRTNLPKLVPEQRAVYDQIMGAIAAQSGGLYFLDAPGGTGKTFLISLILATIRSQRNIALALASSGIAATLLDGGRTAHSALKLPLNLQFVEVPTCNISKNSGMGTVLQSCKLIVWDECTMAHKKSLEALDRTLQDFRGNERLFGGAVILLSGDFRQTLPVLPRSTSADELNACLKSSALWRHVQTLNLTVNMRVQIQRDASAETFAKQLLDLGNGNIAVDPATNCITFPQNFCNLSASQK